jgi:hypothetical protein
MTRRQDCHAYSCRAAAAPVGLKQVQSPKLRTFRSSNTERASGEGSTRRGLAEGSSLRLTYGQSFLGAVRGSWRVRDDPVAMAAGSKPQP